jgi:hypothetical protein
MSKIRLTLELVPSSSWFNNVRAVVSNAEWDHIKRQVFTKAWYVCEICGNVGSKHPVECHEIWSYDDVHLIQKLDGMIALCPDCHMVKHIGFANTQGKGNKALKHFMKVNKLTKKKAEDYIVNAFQVWFERSAKKWTLDISILSQYGIDLSKITVKK